MKSDIYQNFKNTLHQSVQSHSLRVGILTAAMAAFAPKERFAQYGLDFEELKTALLNGGSNHDIGKALLPKNLMIKPLDFFPADAISEQAYKRHPVNSKEIITQCRGDFGADAHVQVALDMGLYHHERYDGTGYPYGLTGDGIPFAAQLCAVANRLDHNISFAKTAGMNKVDFRTAIKLTLENAGLAGKEALDCLEKAQEEIRELYESRNKRRPN